MKKAFVSVLFVLLTLSCFTACGETKYNVTATEGSGIASIELTNDLASAGEDCDVIVSLKPGYTYDSLVVKANNLPLTVVEMNPYSAKYTIKNINQNVAVHAAAENLHEIELRIDDFTAGLLDAQKIEVYANSTSKLTFSDKIAVFRAEYGMFSFLRVKYNDNTIDHMSVAAFDDEEIVDPLSKMTYFYTSELKADERVFPLKITLDGDDDELSFELNKYVPDGSKDLKTYISVFNATSERIPYGENIEFSRLIYGDSNDYAIYTRPLTSSVFTEVSKSLITKTPYETDNDFNVLSVSLGQPAFYDIEVMLEWGGHPHDLGVKFERGSNFAEDYFRSEAHLLLLTDGDLEKTEGHMYNDRNGSYFNFPNYAESEYKATLGYVFEITTTSDVQLEVSCEGLDIVRTDMRSYDIGEIMWVYKATPSTTGNGFIPTSSIVTVNKTSSVRTTTVKLGSDKFYVQSNGNEILSSRTIENLTYAIIDKTAPCTLPLSFTAFPGNGVTLPANKILILKVTSHVQGLAYLSGLNTYNFDKRKIENVTDGDNTAYLTISDARHVTDTINFYIVTSSQS